MRLFILKKNHILVLVCALDLFKKDRRYSDEVINRNTPFWTVNDRKYVFHFRPKPKLEKHLALG